MAPLFTFIGIITFMLLLTWLIKPQLNFVSDDGTLLKKPQPFYYSGNKQQKIYRSNMLRISKLRKQKHK